MEKMKNYIIPENVLLEIGSHLIKQPMHMVESMVTMLRQLQPVPEAAAKPEAEQEKAAKPEAKQEKAAKPEAEKKKAAKPEAEQEKAV